MTISRRVVRDGRGFISSVVDEDGSRLVHIERDEAGRLLGARTYLSPTSPTPELVERVDRVEEGLEDTKRQTAEVAQLLDLRSERLKRRIDTAVAPPEPASWGEYEDRVKRLSARLGNVRDGGPLHLAVLGAVTAAQGGDVSRACQLLRAEDRP